MFCSHSDQEAAKQRRHHARDVWSWIRSPCSYPIIFCHDASKRLLLAGGDRLTEGAIASALGGFKGTLIMAYCMCHASSLQPVAASSLMCGEVTVDRPTNDSIHNLAKTCRRIVKVFSCDRSETIKPAQALTFSRLLGRMIRDRPLYKELQEWVEKTWAECRTITQEPPSMWRPAPIVSVYTSPATLARQDHEQERFME